MRDDEHEFIKSIINYSPDTGNFIWKHRSASMFAKSKNPSQICAVWNARLSGKQAGAINAVGYKVISINNKHYSAHRLAWFYVYGKWPLLDIDHINLNKTDNRICNLREASRSQNQMNTAKYKNNTSGYKGVSFFKRDKKWQAYTHIDGKRKHLGYFNTAQEAHDAYLSATYINCREFCRAF